MKTPPIFKPARTIQCAASGSVYEIVEAKVVAEQPVLLSVNGEAWLTLICTPQVLEALAVGFLYNEGILQSMAEVASCQLSPDYTSIEITLRHPVHKPTHWHRTITSMSGLPDDATTPWKAPCRNQILLESQEIPRLFRDFILKQELHNEIGGFHSAALSDGHEILLLVEDIGRHNTLDKLAGLTLIQKADLEPKVILLSGRISSEMLFKIQRIGACMAISRTSPTSHAIHLAEEWDITLVGYTRGERFTIYTHPERILLPPSK